MLLFLFFVWICGFYYGSFRVESGLSNCYRVLSVLFSILITSLGEESAGVCAFRAIVCLFYSH